MSRQIRVIGIKRKEIDEDKLALAFLLLAKTLHDEKPSEQPATSAGDSEAT
jgi:hypothetical protein